MFDGYLQHYGQRPPGWSPPYEYEVKAARVVDGDTVDLAVDLGFRDFVQDRFRLADDFDAWEKRTPTLEQGKAAEARLRELLVEARGVRVVTEKDLRQRAKRGKFGRYIARLFIYSPARGERWINVVPIMRAEGHEKHPPGASQEETDVCDE